jgi:hypothetical protein
LDIYLSFGQSCFETQEAHFSQQPLQLPQPQAPFFFTERIAKYAQAISAATMAISRNPI